MSHLTTANGSTLRPNGRFSLMRPTREMRPDSQWAFGMLTVLALPLFVAQFLMGYLGYSLVWGQISFWIVAQLSSLDVIAPGLGSMLVGWLWGA
jgi:quinol-cytochrome oxidoreductase complex cytochrome b subunit